jgi:formylglycine-generating enzyme required for sulfatase activity
MAVKPEDRPILTRYMDELHKWAKTLEQFCDYALLYGSIPNDHARTFPEDPSDFDILCRWKDTLENSPFERFKALQHLRTQHQKIIRTQKRLQAGQSFFEHSYMILTPLECYYNIAKDDDTESFFQLKQNKHDLIRSVNILFTEISRWQMETVPPEKQYLEKVLEEVQRQRKAYVITPAHKPTAKNRNVYSHGSDLKKLYRKSALYWSRQTGNNPETALKYGLDKLKEHANAYNPLSDQTLGFSWKQTLQRLNACVNPSTWKLVPDDCMLLWEFLAQQCYAELRKLQTTPQRCDAFLKKLCQTAVHDWTSSTETGIVGKEERLRYQANGLSVQIRSEVPPELLTRKSENDKKPDEQPIFQSIGDQHGANDELFTNMFHWIPTGNDSEDAVLCRRADSPRIGGKRFLVAEDAGTGKSIFLRRLQAWLSDEYCQKQLFDSQPPLVMRWQADGSERMPWPTPDKDQDWPQFWRQELITQLTYTRADLLKQHNISATQLVDHVMQTPSRIVLLLDAFDQLTDPNVDLRRTVLRAFRDPPSDSDSTAKQWSQVNVVVTSRKIAVRDRLNKDGLFSPSQWVIARLDGWTARQQVWYLQPLLDRCNLAINLKERIAPALKNENKARELLKEKALFGEQTAETRMLLAVPLLLRMLSQLTGSHGEKAPEFPRFKNRADLYKKTTTRLLSPETLKAAIDRDNGTRLIRDNDPVLEDARRYLGILAFEMMLKSPGTWILDNRDNWDSLKTRCLDRARDENLVNWSGFRDLLGKLAIDTFFLITEQPTDQFFAWKHREMMEYFCADFLSSTRNPRWGTQPRSPNPRCQCNCENCRACQHKSETTPSSSEAVECNEDRLKTSAANPQWDSTWRFVFELIELDAPSEPVTDTTTSAPVSVAASLSTLFERNEKFPRPTERMWDALRWAKHHNWHEFDHWKLKLNRQFQDILKGRDQQTAALAATLLPPEGLTKYGVAPANAVEEGETANWQLCPPHDSQDSQLQDWLKQRQVQDQPGTFWFRQGSPSNVGFSDEHPRHWWPVRRFWMQASTVTVAQYRLFDPGRLVAEKENLDQKAKQEDCPMIRVNWYDAALFACWVGDKCRLPSESEWEFACRAGFDEENHRYSVQNAGSMTIDKSMANYGNPMDGETVPVRRYAPNRWGLWQMHGNVWEWCVDPKISNYTHKNYTHKVVGSFKTLIENLENNPPQPHPIIAVPDHTYTVGPSRVLRGGSWYDRGDFLRCARRFGRAPVDRYRSVGFRLCWGE